MEIPGVAGVHVMAIGNEASIPGILRQAGLAAGRLPGAGAAAREPAAREPAADEPAAGELADDELAADGLAG